VALADRILGYRDLEPNGFVNPDTGKAYSRKHIADMMRRKTWPQAVQVSDNRIGWWESALSARYANLPVARSIRRSERTESLPSTPRARAAAKS
jgi:hypothetical protein